MATCPVCSAEQTPTTTCVVDGDLHVTFGTVFATPKED